jgi:hypothetical protein
MPVAGDIQVALSENGFGFGSDYIKALPINFEEDEISGPYDCWDLVGVRDFNVHAQIKDIDIEIGDEVLRISMSFESIYGSDMELFTEDEEYFDLCPEYSTELLYLTIENLYFELELSPSINDEGLLEMEVVGEPIVYGDIDMDISWFPDNLVLYFFEDTIFDMISEKLRGSGIRCRTCRY